MSNFLYWWRRWESNPRPENSDPKLLRAYPSLVGLAAALWQKATGATASPGGDPGPARDPPDRLIHFNVAPAGAANQGSLPDRAAF